MAKFFIALTVLCAFGGIMVLGEFNKEEAIAQFMVIADECKQEAGAADGKL